MASRRRRIIVVVTGACKLFCWAGPLEPVVRLEVFGRHLFWLSLLVHTVWAVLGADVAEAAFLRARHSGGWLVGRQSADQCSQVLYELVVHSLRRYAHRMVEVGGLPSQLEIPVLLQRSRDGVQVNHHLDDVTGPVLPGLDVDDDRLAVPLRDQVGLARQRCRPAVEFEAVLSLDVHIKATVLPVCFSLVEERGVVQHPLGLVELGRDLGPVLVMGLEPDGPLTGVLSG